ncbi:MAG: DUF3089 domain-containing protein [Christensenellaceae bacterium]
MDYSSKSTWAFLPKKITKPVDVFFVYPTVYIHPRQHANHYMNIYHPLYRTLAKTSAAWQGQLFGKHCNFFAPYYRQVGMECLNMTDEEFFRTAKKPYRDIKSAFLYYLHHLNDGRPFILAGHSQGSAMLLELMRQEFKEHKLQKKLIASYLIGFSITHDDFIFYPHLKIAKAADDLGVIISYNTTAKGLNTLRVVLKDAVCVNPLNWKLDGSYAPKEQNLGAVVLSLGDKLKWTRANYTGAYVDKQKGVLMIDDDAAYRLYKARSFLKKILMNKGSLHMLDIPLFYENLKENVGVRIEKYLETHAQNSL